MVFILDLPNHGPQPHHRPIHLILHQLMSLTHRLIKSNQCIIFMKHLRIIMIQQ